MFYWEQIAIQNRNSKTQANINTQTLNKTWQLTKPDKPFLIWNMHILWNYTHVSRHNPQSPGPLCLSRPFECLYAVNNLSINNGVEPGTAKAPVGVSVVCALEIIADSVIPSQPPELRLCFWTVEVSLLMFCSIFIKKTWSAQSMLSYKVTL